VPPEVEADHRVAAVAFSGGKGQARKPTPLRHLARKRNNPNQKEGDSKGDGNPTSRNPVSEVRGVKASVVFRKRDKKRGKYLVTFRAKSEEISGTSGSRKGGRGHSAKFGTQAEDFNSLRRGKGASYNTPDHRGNAETNQPLKGKIGHEEEGNSAGKNSSPQN